MVMNLLQRVIRGIEAIAPLKLAEPWDNVGVLVETPIPKPNASKVFLCIDLTPEVCLEAVNDPLVGVIVCYHPLLFKPITKLKLSDRNSATALLCASAGISVFSPHTSLDSCVGGINDWLARGLGNGKTNLITPSSLVEGAGSGRVHNLELSIHINDLIAKVKLYLGLEKVRFAKSATGREHITSIAICAGSGSSVLKGVAADVYLTGEMSHHELLAINAAGIHVILTEHSNSERGYLAEVLQPRLLALLQIDSGLGIESDKNVSVVVSKFDKDPIAIV